MRKVQAGLAASLWALTFVLPAQAEIFDPANMARDPQADYQTCYSAYRHAIIEGMGLHAPEISARIQLLFMFDVKRVAPPPLQSGADRTGLVGTLQTCEETYAYLEAFLPAIDFGYLAPALSEAADTSAQQGQIGENGPDYAMTCAANYTNQANTDPEFLRRQQALIQRFGLDQVMVDKMAAADSAIQKPMRVVVSDLAACDYAYGFATVTWYAATQPAIPQISNWDCAVAYWLYGTLEVQHQQIAIERLEFAGSRLLEEYPFWDLDETITQIVIVGRGRIQPIQQGMEDTAMLQAELNSCEAKYGFGQTEGQ